MSVEKKTVRSDIPGSHVFLNGNIAYAGSTADEGRRLVVGREITLTGQIASCNHLVIEGVVQAEAFVGRRMDILESGLFTGTAEVQDCVIAGRFDGTLSVLGRLTLKSTGHIQGEVRYGMLEVEAGAKMDSRMLSVASVVAEAPLLAPINNNVEKLFTNTPDAPVVPERATAYRRTARA